MPTLRDGAPNRRCDAVIDRRPEALFPCPNRATSTLVPTHVPGVNFTLTYWCKSHAPEIN